MRDENDAKTMPLWPSNMVFLCKKFAAKFIFFLISHRSAGVHSYYSCIMALIGRPLSCWTRSDSQCAHQHDRLLRYGVFHILGLRRGDDERDAAARLLLELGAHLDMVDKKGETAANLWLHERKPVMNLWPDENDEQNVKLDWRDIPTGSKNPSQNSCVSALESPSQQSARRRPQFAGRSHRFCAVGRCIRLSLFLSHF